MNFGIAFGRYKDDIQGSEYWVILIERTNKPATPWVPNKEPAGMLLPPSVTCSIKSPLPASQPARVARDPATGGMDFYRLHRPALLLQSRLAAIWHSSYAAAACHTVCVKALASPVDPTHLFMCTRFCYHVKRPSQNWRWSSPRPMDPTDRPLDPNPLAIGGLASSIKIIYSAGTINA